MRARADVGLILLLVFGLAGAVAARTAAVKIMLRPVVLRQSVAILASSPRIKERGGYLKLQFTIGRPLIWRW